MPLPRLLALLLPGALALSGAPMPLRAQALALRTFSARDGLAHGRVNCVFQDRRGYLWFGTWEGLSRFDGRRFRTYGTADGLPNATISCIGEDGAGQLWVGTFGDGLARLQERPRDGTARFEALHVAAVPRADDVCALQFSRDGALWIGSGTGIHRAVPQATGFAVQQVLATAYPVAADDGQSPVFFASDLAAEVAGGALVMRALPAMGGGDVVAALPAAAGRFFVARQRELAECELQPGAALVARSLRPPLQPGETITALASGPRGCLWVGTTEGLLRREAEAWQRLSVQHGLPDRWVRCLFVDRDDSLWIGTHRGGAARLADRAAVSFGEREGLRDRNVLIAVETPAGRVYASTDSGGIHQVLDDRVVPLPGPPEFDSVHMRLCCDDRGDFWLGTKRGLWSCRGPELELARCRPLSANEGLPDVAVCAGIHADAEGAIWFSTIEGATFAGPGPDGRFRRAPSPTDAGDVSPCRVLLPSADGVLMASYDHLWRSTGDRCTRVPIPGGELLRPRCLWRDRRGWTWIGTRYLGAFVLRPDGEPRAQHFTTRDGLLSDTVWSIAEDAHGNIYFGTGHGISRWDADSSAVREFASADVLAGEVVNHVLVDRSGRLWASTSGGLSRLHADDAPRPAPLPRVYLTQVQVDGEALPVAESGVERLAGVELAPGQRRLEVGFVGLEFRGVRALRYQHRMRGLDDEWSACSEATAVQFADLAPGDYEFLVRAVDADGRASAEPAGLEFRVLPPLWQQAWFLPLCALSIALSLWWWHRARLRRAVATERLRTQIATDLHDEVGAGLAQIAILTEVARRRAEPELAAGLGEVAGLARGLREAMSDIVWALAQGHDTLADLVQRMRHFTGRMLEGDGVQVAFAAPAPLEIDAIALTIEQRRQLWLWFKEALANVVRHAAAGRVEVELALADGHLRLAVKDDGRGFTPDAARAGHGLPSLRQRTARLRGLMSLQSAPGAGTVLVLTVPLPRRRPA